MTPLDYIQSHRDAILIRAGALDPNAPQAHPAAADLRDKVLLPELAKFCSALADSRRGGGTQARVQGSGFTSLDFGNALADAVRFVTQTRMVAHMRHEAFCKPLPVPDYKEQRFPMLAVGTDLVLLREGSEAPESMVSDEAGALAGLSRYGRNVLVSREVLLADDIGLIMTVFENLGGAAARVEAKLAYALIESNPALSDGELMFDAGHGNVLESAFGEVALGDAMRLLRAMPDPFGEVLDHDPAVLVVESALELHARRLVREAGLELEVVASSRLPNGRWYLLPKPDLAPVVGLLRLANSKSPVSIDAARDKLARDGVMFACRTTAAVVPLGRTAIKGGA